MEDTDLYERWWRARVDSGNAEQSIEEWLRSGLIRGAADQRNVRLYFYPFTRYISSLRDVRRLLEDVMVISRSRSDMEPQVIRRAVVRVVTTWDFTDDRLSKAIAVSFDIAGGLKFDEVCDALYSSADRLIMPRSAPSALLAAPLAADAVVLAAADMASKLDKKGTVFLDALTWQCRLDVNLHHLVPFFVSRRLKLCERAGLDEQRELVLSVVLEHKKALVSCGPAIRAIAAVTDVFVEKMRPAEGHWTEEQMRLLQEAGDALDDEILRQDEGVRAALDNLDASRRYGLEPPLVPSLLKIYE